MRTYRDEDAVDVVIIGAGPAGAVAAKRLSEEGDVSVVVLERGDWQDYSTIRADEPDFELSGGRDWSPRPHDRARPWDQAIDESDSDVGVMIWNGVGGSAVAYAAQWHRNMPSDFRTRTLDGVGDDWPISYEELAPYYRRIERDFAVSGLNGDPAFPDTDYPMPPVRLRAWGERIARAHNELGWHWWPASNAIATTSYGRLRPNTERGTEMAGSPDGSKSTPDVTHWPDAIAAGVELRVRSTVVGIDTDEAGRANAVVYLDADGVERRQRARIVILAANGVHTPWLLLRSTSKRFPDGLANTSGLVGKRLMMHPLSTVVGVFDDPIQSWQGAWGQQAYSMQFYETDASRGFVRGAKWALTPAGGPLATTLEYPWGKADFWGEGFHRTVAARMGHAASWSIISEDLPYESNTVTVSDTVTDANGLAVPKITYRIDKNSSDLLRWHEQRAVESWQAAGASSTVVAPAIRNTGWHLLGTAKMGADRRTSVVDADGRCHDVPNLFVFDGSTWPTSSGTNPTATVVALALRNTEKLIENRSSQEVPS
ncbi:MAG: GMC family oxidoreductase [Microbacterium sp.]|uniref:GMC oxidoreductase n=1 Tax=Microbacterium sp. TaxID=51671 RepID=UPI001AD21942|nr:GMC family oxidoreductase [Microbacterium sp.]MBN9177462.1 GMC family oxidoreductase [Microbacterium sp.]